MKLLELAHEKGMYFGRGSLISWTRYPILLMLASLSLFF